jgi:hypothetical protein
MSDPYISDRERGPRARTLEDISKDARLNPDQTLRALSPLRDKGYVEEIPSRKTGNTFIEPPDGETRLWERSLREEGCLTTLLSRRWKERRRDLSTALDDDLHNPLPTGRCGSRSA